MMKILREKGPQDTYKMMKLSNPGTGIIHTYQELVSMLSGLGYKVMPLGLANF